MRSFLGFASPQPITAPRAPANGFSDFRHGLLTAILTLVLLAACVQAASAEKWKIQFFHDKDKSVLNIVDLQFPSAARGMAIGSVHEGNREKPVAVVTSDGGTNWLTIDLREEPVSLFFLSESLGWMVTAKGGLWQTTEAGKNWRKLTRMPAQVIRVYFTTERDG